MGGTTRVSLCGVILRGLRVLRRFVVIIVMIGVMTTNGAGATLARRLVRSLPRTRVTYSSDTNLPVVQEELRKRKSAQRESLGKKADTRHSVNEDQSMDSRSTRDPCGGISHTLRLSSGCLRASCTRHSQVRTMSTPKSTPKSNPLSGPLPTPLFSTRQTPFFRVAMRRQISRWSAFSSLESEMPDRSRNQLPDTSWKTISSPNSLGRIGPRSPMLSSSLGGPSSRPRPRHHLMRATPPGTESRSGPGSRSRPGSGSVSGSGSGSESRSQTPSNNGPNNAGSHQRKSHPGSEPRSSPKANFQSFTKHTSNPSSPSFKTANSLSPKSPTPLHQASRSETIPTTPTRHTPPKPPTSSATTTSTASTTTIFRTTTSPPFTPSTTASRNQHSHEYQVHHNQKTTTPWPRSEVAPHAGTSTSARVQTTGGAPAAEVDESSLRLKPLRPGETRPPTSMPLSKTIAMDKTKESARKGYGNRLSQSVVIKTITTQSGGLKASAGRAGGPQEKSDETSSNDSGMDSKTPAYAPSPSSSSKGTDSGASDLGGSASGTGSGTGGGGGRRYGRIGSEFWMPEQGKYDLRKIEKALSDRIEKLVQVILSDPNPSLTTDDEIRFGNKGSLCVTTTGLYRGRWYDFETGEGGGALNLIKHATNCDFKTALYWALEFLENKASEVALPIAKFSAEAQHPSLPHQRVQRQQSTPHATWTKEERRNRTREYGMRLYMDSKPILGSLGERYLREHRGIRKGLSNNARALRFHPMVLTGKQDNYMKLPSLIAVARDSEGNVVGIQATYLNPKTANKFPNLHIPKRTYGPIKGAIVTLTETDDPDKVSVSEKRKKDKSRIRFE
ncbi:hypothetical protein AAMO2058_001669300 [Amorphochlora amoebiformis]